MYADARIPNRDHWRRQKNNVTRAMWIGALMMANVYWVSIPAQETNPINKAIPTNGMIRNPRRDNSPASSINAA